MKYLNSHFSHIRMCLFSLAALLAMAGCQAQSQQPDPNRAYFEIHPISNTMVLPVTIDDSVTARMVFDTGADLLSFDLDSAFCAAHPLHLWQGKPDTVYSHGGGTAWVRQHSKGDLLVYKNDFAVKLGETNANYKWVNVWDRNAYFGHADYDGLFNMPPDTAHVWELNFEHNYIELHPTATFTVPKGCISVPIYINKTNRKPYATIPMKITTSDGDTLTITRDFLVDTGMGWDVVIAPPAEELSFFEGKQSVPFHFGAGGYISRHIVDATVFDGFHMDSLRIYTLKDRVHLPTGYLVGLNFLKRFNVFIDLKNSRMYLQPLKKFHRAFSTMWKRFDIDVSPTKTGSYIVTQVMDHEFNHYKKAGIRAGDEIVGINGVTLTPQTTPEEHTKLIHNYRVVFDIVRDGKNIQLVMERDPDEIQGD